MVSEIILVNITRREKPVKQMACYVVLLLNPKKIILTSGIEFSI